MKFRAYDLLPCRSLPQHCPVGRPKKSMFRIFIDVLCERGFVVKKKFVRAKLKTVKFSLSGTSHTF